VGALDARGRGQEWFKRRARCLARTVARWGWGKIPGYEVAKRLDDRQLSERVRGKGAHQEPRSRHSDVRRQLMQGEGPEA
jgi:hypothetical protein